MTYSKNAFGTTELLARVITMSLRSSEKLTVISIDLMGLSHHRRLWRLDVAFRHVEETLESPDERFRQSLELELRNCGVKLL
jgi:hypothetical protein